jgi:pimeloyl-ACP methyl ester carboxylesterase
VSYIERDGARIWYEESGTGDPAVVLVHGWCCDSSDMRPLAQHLTARHHVLSLDLRGHGKSTGGLAGPSMDDYADDVLAVAALAKARSLVLVGHSLGGRVVLAAMTRGSRALAGAVLVLAGAVLLDPAIEEDPDYVAARRRELDAPTATDLLRQRFERLFGPDVDGRGVIVERMLRTPRAAAVAALEASDEFDASDALRGSADPMLYIASSDPHMDLPRLLALKPDLMYAQVVGAGHFVQLEATDQVNAMVDRFLALTASS